MTTRRVGIRELKATLSECVREVSAGHAIVVTEHGRPVARIIAESSSPRERIQALQSAEAVSWSGRALRAVKPVARTRGKRTVSDLVSENRD
jgi:prevent-host-death family protein